MESKAALMGLPMQLAVDDGLRYSDCSAHMANLVSIEGKMAIYEGECDMGHHYDMKMNVEDIKKQAHIENGEIVFGGQKGYEATELEEF